MRCDRIAALHAFRLIAAHGSFTRAAGELDITPSALSQALRQLERSLGVRLLNRTTRRVGLSEAGRAFLDRVAPALTESRRRKKNYVRVVTARSAPCV